MDELNNNVENTGVTQGVNKLPDPYENQKIINVKNMKMTAPDF